MFKKLCKNEKGFTLAELLIVVAIIGVLVAISIPIFTAQLEKAREATDAANLRAAYAEVSADAILNDGTTTKKVPVDQKQTKGGWETTIDLPFTVKNPVDNASKGYWTVEWDTTNNEVIAK